MNNSTSHTSDSDIALVDLVGRPCRFTRVGACCGHGTLSTPHLAGCLLRCPRNGASMWLMVGGSNWIRTSPVTATITTTAPDEIRLVVLTRDARYQLEFDRATLNDHLVGPSQDTTIGTLPH